MCCQTNLLGKIHPRDSLSSQAPEQQEKLRDLPTQAPRLANPPTMLSPGEEDAQVFPGASQQIVSQAWHPPTSPRVKPQTKTTQLSADLTTLPGDGGTHGPEVDACVHARTHARTRTHTHTHASARAEPRGTQTQKHTRQTTPKDLVLTTIPL